MKNICILFNGGSYGTFVEWCLNYFTGNTTRISFNINGNAHNFCGNHLINFSECVKYINSSYNFPIVRFHPKTLKDENLIDNLKFINKHFKKVIYLIPTKNSIAWNLNNKFEKIFKEGWLTYNELSLFENLNKWNVQNLKEMKPWEIREFLSLYIYSQHLAETELEKLSDIQKNFMNFHFITIDELRDNFKDTIASLLEYCNFIPTKLNETEEIFQEWINCQYHCNKDTVIDNIVDSILNNIYYDWTNQNLTLIDEALIQYYLRQHDIEVKCWQLNNFPTNTIDIRKHLDYLT